MPNGLKQSHVRDPRNFTHAQWQQAKRINKDPKQIKAVFQKYWSASDTQSAFAHALKERGYVLARGDRRGFVAVDHRGEVFAVSKWAGIKTKEVSTKLTDGQSLPSADETRIQIAKDMTVRLDTLFQEQANAFETRMTQLEERRQTLMRQHKAERQQVHETAVILAAQTAGMAQ
jgi:hypothetical protein